MDWASVSVPGKECLSADPIHLAQGQARLPDTSYSTGYRLLSTESKSPVYGQLGGRTAAALYRTCSTGGGTAGDTIRDSYAVFTGSQGRLTVVGLITAQVEQANAGAATGLSDLQFQAGGITVREGYYLPDDGLCCPLGVARTTWSLTGNELVPNGPAQVAAGRAVSVHGTATGRDYEGVVWAHDLITDCADNAYGNIMIAFLRAHPCSRASRRLVTFAVNNRQVALSIISVEIPGTATDDFGNAGKFLQVEQADGTGGINDLLRDGSRIPDGPAAKTTSSSLRSAKSIDSEQKALCRVAHS